MKKFWLPQLWLLAVCLLPAEVSRGGVITLLPPLPPTEKVQEVLLQMSRSAQGHLVSYIPETRRYYISNYNRMDVEERWLVAIQNAFYQDTHELFKFYGRKYLADWKALMSKGARESYWGASFLCNRTFNYFGIRRANKEWVCSSFAFCYTFDVDTYRPEGYVQFANFESSLWMFVHTIYSRHYLERLPDRGNKVIRAIEYERRHGIHYWENARHESSFAFDLPGQTYTADQLIYTWSGHAVNNYCEDCDRVTDMEWVRKIDLAESRSRR